MRRFWRVLKFTGLGLVALVAIGLIWLAAANARAKARLEARVQELREQQLPTSVSDLKPMPTPPEKDNAVTYLNKAQSAVIAISRGVSAVCEAAGENEYDDLWMGRLSPKTAQAIRDLLAMHPRAVELLMQASRCPHLDSQYDYDAGTLYGGAGTEFDSRTFLEQVLDCTGYKREVFRVLYYQTLLLLNQGKPLEALRICEAMLRLASLVGTEPLLVNYQVANALYSFVTFNAINQVLRAGPLPPAAYEKLEAALAADDLAAQFRHAMITERAYSLQSLREMVWDRGLVLPGFGGDNLAMIDTFDTFAESTDRPFDSQLRAELKSLAQPRDIFTGLLLPSLKSTRQSLARVQAQQRCARVLNQLVLKDPDGAKGLAIEQLGLPAVAPIDPFDGNPLRIKHTDAGWLVYSVGENLKDDGGQVDDDSTDVGLAPVPPLVSKTQPQTDKQ